VVIHFLYEELFQRRDKLRNILVTAVVAALVKIVLNIFKYTLTGTLFGGSSLPAAFLLAVAEITGTFGSSLATVIAVPILYPIFQQVRKAHKQRSPLEKQG
jgi:hypothetical protein